MQRIPKEEINELIKKYTSKLEKNISRDSIVPKRTSEFSLEYEKFREETISGGGSTYEKLAKFAGKIINTKPNDKIIPKLKESLEVAHLNLTLREVSAFSIFYPLLIGRHVKVQQKCLVKQNTLWLNMIPLSVFHFIWVMTIYFL